MQGEMITSGTVMVLMSRDEAEFVAAVLEDYSFDQTLRLDRHDRGEEELEHVTRENVEEVADLAWELQRTLFVTIGVESKDDDED
jgi:hypothetical protein